MRSSHHYISHYWREKKGEEKDIKLEPKKLLFQYPVIQHSMQYGETQ